MRSSHAVAPRGVSQRIPDFFIVGHHKCGTTALYEMLRGHPQVHMPVKEPSFFAPEIRSHVREDRPVTHRDTLDAYAALFGAAGPEQLVGEASPSYLWSREAAKRIAEIQPGARIIAILREPAAFLSSLHLQWLRSNAEVEKNLRKAMALENLRREGKGLPRNSTRPQLLFYSEHVQYVEQLRRYHAVFPREQVLVLIYDDFRAENEATVRKVQRFLGIHETLPVELIDVNRAVRIRSPHVDWLVRSLYLGRGRSARTAKTVIKTVTSRRLRRGALAFQRRVQRGRPLPPDPELMLDLRRRFKGEVVALSEYLDRDLVRLWGYDAL